jgi:hypothetical protein
LCSTKLTPFVEEERTDLEAGLGGVKEGDLLEIYIDYAPRYLSSITLPVYWIVVGATIGAKDECPHL